MRISLCVSYLLALTLATSATAAAEGGKLVALIIGNDSYSNRPLQNAVNDARAMDKALRAAGFRTILRENATKAVMELAAAELVGSMGPDDTALFFYAGHAVQIQNENHLVPVDFEGAKTVVEAKFRSLSLNLILDYLKGARPKKTIIIIDACRSNPVADKHSFQAGLAIPLNAGRDTYIAFSTSPNSVANDNPDGKNSWFTEALADLITQDSLTLDEVFTRVRMRVEKATNGSQTPWSQTSLTSKFYFHPPKTMEAANDPDMADRWLQDALRHEQRGNWNEAAELLNRILKQPASGTAKETAKVRLPYVQIRVQAAKQFEEGQYASAAAAFEEALRLDPYAFDAATGAVNSYLLAESVPKATAVLQRMRERGSSAIAAKADAILQELSPISPEASADLKRGVPQPPPVQELFAARQFGVPDWSAAQRLLKQAPTVDLVALTKQLPELKAMEVTQAPAAAAAAAVPPRAAGAEGEDLASLDTFHVDVHGLAGGTRDLISEEFGDLTLRSDQPAPVMLNGKTVAHQFPYTMKLPAGKYVVSTMDRGKVLTSREITVPPGSFQEVVLK
ncbi:MAG: caspase family protein [Bryobacteraceae bacterium]